MDTYEMFFWIMLGAGAMLPIVGTAWDQVPE